MMRFSDKMKKVFSAVLCLLMLVQLLPMHVHAVTTPAGVAKVIMGGVETYYVNLSDAIKAVKNAAAADNAVVQLLQNVNLGTGLILESGVFTLDLNGKTITSAHNLGTLDIGSSTGVDLTITDTSSDSSGKIENTYSYGSAIYASDKGTLTIKSGTITGVGDEEANGVFAVSFNGTVNINGGNISGYRSVVVTGDGTLNITGGTITGELHGVEINNADSLTISGGKITAQGDEWYSTGVYVSNTESATITGGTITGEEYDLYCGSEMRLLAVDNGTGATFPGGLIAVMPGDAKDEYTRIRLSELLDEGAAYWQDGKQLTLDGTETEITGGDVVIKNACEHDKATYTDITDAAHTISCSCGKNEEEAHTIDPKTGKCACSDVMRAAAQVTMGDATTFYMTLGEAITAVESATAADSATVKLLDKVELGTGALKIERGVFTLDLNGKTIESNVDSLYSGTLYISNADVTIVDNAENVSGKIENTNDAGHGVYIANAGKLTVKSGTITGKYGIYNSSDRSIVVSIEGGNITGDSIGVYISYSGALNISGGNITGQKYGVMFSNSDVLTITGGTIKAVGTSDETEIGVLISGSNSVSISGGSIAGTDYDLDPGSHTELLTVAEGATEGATFPGGLRIGVPDYRSYKQVSAYDYLADGAAYWQDGKQLELAVTGPAINGDVVVMKACKHAGATFTDNGDDTHTVICENCGKNAQEAHTMDHQTGKCACGVEMAVVKMTVGAEVTYYDTLASAIKAADGKNAVLDLMDNVVLDGFLYNDKENTQLVLNLSEKTITLKGSGELELRKGAKMTINGDGKVTYAEGYTQPAFISLTEGSTLTVNGGTYEMKTNVFMLDGSDGACYLTINGGTFKAESPVANTMSSTITVTGSPVFEGADREFGVDENTVLDLSGAQVSDGWRVYNNSNASSIEVGTHIILPAGYMLKLGDSYTTILRCGEDAATIALHTPHEYDRASDGDETHSGTCICGAKSETEVHTLTYAIKDALVHTVRCEDNCGYMAEKPHSFEENKASGEKAGDATCEKGTAYYAQCDHCTAVSDSVIVYADDSLGHDWYDTTYDFAADGSACTAQRVCKRDDSHVESATAVITSAVSKQPTTDAMGDTAYTATFAEDWAEDVTLVLTDIPKLNSVKVEPMRDGSVSLSNTTPATGEEVTITVSPNIGMEVDRVIVRDSEGNEIWSSDSEEGTYTYTQPEGDVTIVVNFKANVYEVKNEAPEGVTVMADNLTPLLGDRVTIVVENSNSGKQIDKVTVIDRVGNEVPLVDNGNGTYTFTQPEGDVTVRVTLKNSYTPPINTGTWEETEAPAKSTDDSWHVLCRKLNVRAGAGTQYRKLGTLTRGTCVEGEMLDNGWVKILWEDGTYAYISGAYLDVCDCEEHDAVDTAAVLCRKLNVRAGAGTQYKRVGSLSRGETVRIVESRGGWHKIVYNDGYAWVCAKYVG